MSRIVIDAIDRKILKYLITNARMPFLEIARKCGISGAAIHQRIKKLDESLSVSGVMRHTRMQSSRTSTCWSYMRCVVI